MRELKFRIWDEDDGEFLGNGADILLDQMGGLWEWNIAHEDAPHPIECKVCVEQYTGLRDKHGKEIYEGDIVKIKSKPYIPDEYIIEGKPIIFMNGLFSVKKSDFVHIPIYLFFNAENITHDIEIIGNIHEDKDLLK